MVGRIQGAHATVAVVGGDGRGVGVVGRVPTGVGGMLGGDGPSFGGVEIIGVVVGLPSLVGEGFGALAVFSVVERGGVVVGVIVVVVLVAESAGRDGGGNGHGPWSAGGGGEVVLLW